MRDYRPFSNCLMVLAAFGMMSQPSLARDSTEESPETNAPPQSLSVPQKPSISIQQPIGTVVVSRVGDELGGIRYGNRTQSGGVSVVSFSKTAKGSAATSFVSNRVAVVAPLRSAVRTSNFGYRRDPMTGNAKWHSGIDLAAPTGTPIVATGDGVVSSAGWRGGYGIAVVLEHGNGIQTLYGHMSRLNVQAGERVQAGQVIGTVGSTGRSTGPHLHYELRKDGTPINPAVR